MLGHFEDGCLLILHYRVGTVLHAPSTIRHWSYLQLSLPIRTAVIALTTCTSRHPASPTHADVVYSTHVPRSHCTKPSLVIGVTPNVD